uniref:Neutral alpha-glucosidase AB n=1 Tax=Phallusia mammillata TaxID=59560 RepID=A0A6F9DE22_9ASCI|nr:neutral alpha-glucosidase AB-like [Phallusia mammillata]
MFVLDYFPTMSIYIKQSKRCLGFQLLAIVFLMIMDETEAVDAGNFKRCDQSAFCQRQRNFKPEISPYVTNIDSLRKIDNSHFALDITNTQNNKAFVLDLFALEDSTLRLKINEAQPIAERYEVPNTIEDVKAQNMIAVPNLKNGSIVFHLGDNTNIQAVISCSPFRLDIYDEKEPVFSVNSRNLMHIEHLRQKPVPKPHEEKTKPEEPENPDEEQAEQGENEEEDKQEEQEPQEEEKEESDPDDQPGMWEETFKTHTDSKPRGPESIGLDTSFVNFAHVYGIPEHADKMALKSTVGSEPYRLYNLDVFEYELDSRAALYGSIPFMIGHNSKRTVGLLWLNAAETWVDVDSTEDNKGVLGTLFGYFAGEEAVPEVNVHWMSESGVIDVYFMLGRNPADVMRQYTKLTGTSYMPPMWATTYHQSRWNYKDEQDVKTVDAGFDEHDIPYDCLWLDIEHTDGKRYFTWDTLKFPDPVQMQNALAAKGRKMVTIIDPHIKVDTNYHIYREAQNKGYFIKNKDGSEFKGWCWPGDSAYLDLTLPEVRDWWASQFVPEVYKGSTLNLFTWNDMNEPSVFNGPEITMHKDIIHGAGWEHRHVHNLYGILLQMSTVKGQLARSQGNERPFVLSRAFYIGTQKYGAIWTGDNTAEWGHLAASVPMLLSIGLCGIAHSGADVGGFFKNPDPEMLSRWYQAAAYQPFFRAHAHIDTSRREPWLYDDKYRDIIRAAIRERYELLPYWYTLFFQAHKSGEPPMRPLWYEFPADVSTFDKDDSHMVGTALLVQPVSKPNTQVTSVYLPGATGWFDVKTYQYYPSPNTVSISTPLDKIAVLQRGGTIVPRKMRVRRCSALMTHDPYTLFVAVSPQGTAVGQLYMDDGHTFGFQNLKYNYKNLLFQNNVLISKSANPDASWDSDAWLERVVFMGVSRPTKIEMTVDGQVHPLEFSYESTTRVLTVRKPGVKMQKDWSIAIQ